MKTKRYLHVQEKFTKYHKVHTYEVVQRIVTCHVCHDGACRDVSIETNVDVHKDVILKNLHNDNSLPAYAQNGLMGGSIDLDHVKFRPPASSASRQDRRLVVRRDTQQKRLRRLRSD